MQRGAVWRPSCCGTDACIFPTLVCVAQDEVVQPLLTAAHLAQTLLFGLVAGAGAGIVPPALPLARTLPEARNLLSWCRPTTSSPASCLHDNSPSHKLRPRAGAEKTGVMAMGSAGTDGMSGLFQVSLGEVKVAGEDAALCIALMFFDSLGSFQQGCPVRLEAMSMPLLV